MDKEVVIARYNEDLSWTSSLPSDTLINIYNKSADNFFLQDAKNIKLNNFGRETDTYLRYIVERYETLPDCVFFSQGAINDRLDQKLFPLNIYFSVATTWSFIGALRVCYEGYEWGRELDNIGKISDYTLSFGEFQEKYLNLRYEKHSLFVPGGYFLVGRDLILRRPKDYYENLLATELGSHINPRYGHFMERSWFRIFQGF